MIIYKKHQSALKTRLRSVIVIALLPFFFIRCGDPVKDNVVFDNHEATVSNFVTGGLIHENLEDNLNGAIVLSQLLDIEPSSVTYEDLLRSSSSKNFQELFSDYKDKRIRKDLSVRLLNDLVRNGRREIVIEIRNEGPSEIMSLNSDVLIFDDFHNPIIQTSVRKVNISLLPNKSFYHKTYVDAWKYPTSKYSSLTAELRVRDLKYRNFQISSSSSMWQCSTECYDWLKESLNEKK